MLKALRSSSCLQQARFSTGPSYLQSNSRHTTKLTSPFHGVLRSVLRDKNPKFFQRVFFCSDSGDGSGSGPEAVVEEAESKSAAAIVPTAIKKPDDFLTVILLFNFITYLYDESCFHRKIGERFRLEKFNCIISM